MLRGTGHPQLGRKGAGINCEAWGPNPAHRLPWTRIRPERSLDKPTNQDRTQKRSSFSWCHLLVLRYLLSQKCAYTFEQCCGGTEPSQSQLQFFSLRDTCMDSKSTYCLSPPIAPSAPWAFVSAEAWQLSSSKVAVSVLSHLVSISVFLFYYSRYPIGGTSNSSQMQNSSLIQALEARLATDKKKVMQSN